MLNAESLITMPTPAALIDAQRLKANAAHLARRAHMLGVHLRPHVKTHKCVEAARYQTQSHFGGITVSTLAEAEAFSRNGFTDITYAVPLTPGRATKACQINETIPHFQVIVDHHDAVDALVLAMHVSSSPMNVLIKIDCGYGRAGLLPEDPRLIELAQHITKAPQLRFAGVLAHGGHAYDCTSAQEIEVIAEQERSQTVMAASRVRDAGIGVTVVSVGSTPTACVVKDLTGVTELRPGNYALFDRFQSQIGACTDSDIALSVLTEVIGVYPERGMILVDAGALALSKDPGAIHINSTQSFGTVCTLELEPILGLSLVGLSQEHGKIAIDDSFGGAVPSIGARLRILPNHSCLVTALHKKLYVIESHTITDTWSPVRGW